MMGALLTASDIKAENGDVTCAIDGGGPAGKVLAVASPKGTVRAAIENPEADLPIRQTDGKLDVSGILGHAGRLTVVKDNGGREPYIGQTPAEDRRGGGRFRLLLYAFRTAPLPDFLPALR